MKISGRIQPAVLAISLLCLAASPALAKTENAKKKEIRKLLVLTGTKKMADQMTSQIFSSLRTAHPDLPEKFWKKVTKLSKLEGFMDQMVAIYDRHLDRKVIQAAIKFFKSPEGKKMVSVQPAITMESMRLGQTWGQKLAMEISKEIEKQKSKQKSKKK